MNAFGVGFGLPQARPAPEAEVIPMRRPRVARSPLIARFGALELDEQNARLVDDGRVLEVAPKPFAVLCALARRPGSLVTKNELLDEVWGHRFVTESVLKTVIAKLRRILNDDAQSPRFIETVARRGYRFMPTGETALAPASEIAPPAASRQDATDAAGADRITAERALCEICELLELVMANLDGADRIRPRLLACLARRRFAAS